ncbi:nuclear transport factor 2 family protein [Oceanicoccus sagamiensis]|uniref:SnoaL-like domain-containing protein n=1 Tax=Oceanicoccus sagamiensis TaxID=716816 RepID=A0A1X9NHJ3_9GAMM|nr:nuclear transport factor 2 family protein [Oceanicoccus sagamiensis]ARN75872.1 hypothetical protein BST96_18240 [Oceanicoccus sagamiensis]
MSSTTDLQLQSELIANYNAYAEGLDSKNWALVRSCFCDEVYIDYGDISAPTGAPEIPRKGDDWLVILQTAINGFNCTKHAITNHRVKVDGDSVSCSAYLTADHIVLKDPSFPVIGPDDIATVVGEYTNHYRQVDGQWKICKSQLDVHWSSGNIALFPEAAERAIAMMNA